MDYRNRQRIPSQLNITTTNTNLTSTPNINLSNKAKGTAIIQQGRYSANQEQALALQNDTICDKDSQQQQQQEQALKLISLQSNHSIIDQAQNLPVVSSISSVGSLASSSASLQQIHNQNTRMASAGQSQQQHQQQQQQQQQPSHQHHNHHHQVHNSYFMQQHRHQQPQKVPLNNLPMKRQIPQQHQMRSNNHILGVGPGSGTGTGTAQLHVNNPNSNLKQYQHQHQQQKQHLQKPTLSDLGAGSYDSSTQKLNSKKTSASSSKKTNSNGNSSGDNMTTSSGDQTMDELQQLAHTGGYKLSGLTGPTRSKYATSYDDHRPLHLGTGPNSDFDVLTTSSSGSRFLLGVLFTIAEILLFAVILLWLYWAFQHDDGLAWQADRKQQFNTHAALMLLGFIFLNGQAILIYRSLTCCTKIYTKVLHTIIFVLATSAISFGLMLGYTAQENIGANNKPIMHFYSLHAWSGLATTGLFTLQFLFGFISFLILLCCEQGTSRFRAALLPIHRTFGLIIFSLAVATCLTGLLQTARSRLSSKLGKIDYHELAEAGTLINIIGACLICLAILMPYIIRNLNIDRQTPKVQLRSEIERRLRLSQLDIGI